MIDGATQTQPSQRLSGEGRGPGLGMGLGSVCDGPMPTVSISCTPPDTQSAAFIRAQANDGAFGSTIRLLNGAGTDSSQASKIPNGAGGAAPPCSALSSPTDAGQQLQQQQQQLSVLGLGVTPGANKLVSPFSGFAYGRKSQGYTGAGAAAAGPGGSKAGSQRASLESNTPQQFASAGTHTDGTPVGSPPGHSALAVSGTGTGAGAHIPALLALAAHNSDASSGRAAQLPPLSPGQGAGAVSLTGTGGASSASGAASGGVWSASAAGAGADMGAGPYPSPALLPASQCQGVLALPPGGTLTSSIGAGAYTSHVSPSAANMNMSGARMAAMASASTFSSPQQRPAAGYGRASLGAATHTCTTASPASTAPGCYHDSGVGARYGGVVVGQGQASGPPSGPLPTASNALLVLADRLEHTPSAGMPWYVATLTCLLIHLCVCVCVCGLA